MSNGSIPKTERRYYHPQPMKNEWVSRNENGQNYLPPELTNNSGLNNYFDGEDMSYMTQTIAATSNPMPNYTFQNMQGFTNFNPGSSIPDFRIKSKLGSRSKKK